MAPPKIYANPTTVRLTTDDRRRLAELVTTAEDGQSAVLRRVVAAGLDVLAGRPPAA